VRRPGNLSPRFGGEVLFFFILVAVGGEVSETADLPR